MIQPLDIIRERNRLKTAKHRSKETKLDKKIRHLKEKYKLSWETYMEMYDTQQGSCKICRRPLAIMMDDSVKANSACVDHCHNTGKIRGLLCTQCNRGIGFLQDNPILCRIAAEYLDESNS